MTLPVCVLERSTTGDRWHVIDGSGTDTAQAILCHPTDVINFPGNVRERQPTCVECYRQWRLGRDADPEHMERMELIREVYRLRAMLHSRDFKRGAG